MDLIRTIISQQWLWGVVLGALLGFLGSLLGGWLVRRVERNARQEVAAMQVAGNIRKWMFQSELLLNEIESRQPSSGDGPYEYWTIPDFLFENSLDCVSQMDQKRASDVFELIYAKDRMNAQIEAAVNFANEDEDDVVDLTCERISQVFLEAGRIYRLLMTQIGWDWTAFSTECEARMRGRVSDYANIEKKSREGAVDLQ